MTVAELGKKLRDMYETPGANKVAMIHLFGVIYGKELEANGIKPVEVVKSAQLSESYGTEVNKGIKLSKYVEVKKQYLDRF